MHNHHTLVCTPIVHLVHTFLEEQVSAMQLSSGDAGGSAAILIQMWNLAGPVTNGCDDVWGAKPANFHSALDPPSLGFVG